MRRRFTGIDTTRRNREGWVALPLLIRGLEEARRVVVETNQGRFIVGHTVHSGARWWLIPDWSVKDKDQLPLYEVS